MMISTRKCSPLLEKLVGRFAFFLMVLYVSACSVQSVTEVNKSDQFLSFQKAIKACDINSVSSFPVDFVSRFYRRKYKQVLPLMESIREGCSVELVAYLHRNTSLEGMRLSITPILKSVSKNRKDLVVYFLESGEDPNESSITGGYPIVEAGKVYVDKVIMGLLLSSGANVNAQDAYGNTPLMVSSQSGSLDKVKVLVESGANLNLSSFDLGLTALAFAASKQHDDVVMYLLSLGAKFCEDSKRLNTMQYSTLLRYDNDGRDAMVRRLLDSCYEE